MKERKCPKYGSSITVTGWDDGEVDGVQYVDYELICNNKECDWSDWE